MIAIVGEFNPDFAPHVATNAAIEHSAAVLRMPAEFRWVSTPDIGETALRASTGLWIAPGSPYRDMVRTLDAIRFARENGVPCLGTCGGFQHMIIEYARNVLGFRDAQHAEYDPYASNLFVTRLDCSLAGRDLELNFVPDSFVARCYGSLSAIETYYCNFGVDPEQVSVLRSGPFRIVGADHEGEIRVLELPNHPFFVGTLYVPQARSKPGAPHPLVTAFVRAAVAHSSRTDQSTSP